MRTISVRFSPGEHRVLRDLAAAEGVDLEALIREALALPPLEAFLHEAHLRLVRDAAVSVSEGPRPHPALPRH